MQTRERAALLLLGVLSTTPVWAQSSYTADTVVAMVSGANITLGEVVAARQSLPEQFQSLPDDVMMNALVRQLSDQALLAVAAQEDGIDKTKAFEVALRNERRALLAQAFMTARLLQAVTQEAVEAAYRATYVDVDVVPEVRASHILVAEEALARRIRSELDAGADFSALAQRHGTDGTRDSGGDLGWQARDMMDPAVSDVAFATEPGTVAGPFQSRFGWHLIRVVAVRDRPPPPLAEVRIDLLRSVTEAEQARIIAEAREAGSVVFPDTRVPPDAVRDDSVLFD